MNNQAVEEIAEQLQIAQIDVAAEDNQEPRQQNDPELPVAPVVLPVAEEFRAPEDQQEPRQQDHPELPVAPVVLPVAEEIVGAPDNQQEPPQHDQHPEQPVAPVVLPVAEEIVGAPEEQQELPQQDHHQELALVVLPADEETRRNVKQLLDNLPAGVQLFYFDNQQDLVAHFALVDFFDNNENVEEDLEEREDDEAAEQPAPVENPGNPASVPQQAVALPECTKCGHRLKPPHTPSNFEKHAITHCIEKRFKCPQCPFTSTLSGNVTQHMTRTGCKGYFFDRKENNLLVEALYRRETMVCFPGARDLEPERLHDAGVNEESRHKCAECLPDSPLVEVTDGPYGGDLDLFTRQIKDSLPIHHSLVGQIDENACKSRRVIFEYPLLSLYEPAG